MDNQGRTVLEDVEQLGEDALHAGEKLADRILGVAGADVRAVETIAADVAGKAASSAEAAIAAVKAFGAGHVNLTQLEVTSELAGAKVKVEEAIVAVARHLAGISTNG